MNRMAVAPSFLRDPIPGIGGLRPPFLGLKNAAAERRLPHRGAPE
jgi:hypothetical protein